MMVTDTSQTGFERAAFNYSTLGSPCPVWAGSRLPRRYGAPHPNQLLLQTMKAGGAAGLCQAFLEGGAGVGMVSMRSRCMSE